MLATIDGGGSIIVSKLKEVFDLFVYEIQRYFEPIFAFGAAGNIETSILPRRKSENWPKDLESHTNELEN